MIIGTVRIEESKVYDSHAGYHQFHTDNAHEYGAQEPYGSFEVFWHDGVAEQDAGEWAPQYDADMPPAEQAGWYWAAGFPGCLYDGEPSGPFAYSQQAHQDADEWSPEYDE